MSFPLPRLECVFDTLGESQANIFSSLDLYSGFHHIEMDEETRHKSAFITRNGVYEWLRLPFGLRNSPVSFQMIMTQVLRGLNWKFVLVYVDDILIFSKTFEEHLRHLEQVFSRLRDANLTLKPTKCEFAVKEVKYLGHILSKHGVQVDPSKTDAV
ncbi:Retrovirus-related Pol polyprotein from transposon gypsy,Retrovirus-related Pol polyprotein from transposon 297,Retrovirus-related Pol polyprotein from transposon 17.6,Transposon Ty3-I Gag-Pol polyprotein,Transposon Ty3-G Gag-Pol polyprotein,Retrovirus-related Pol polyprotein from transposon opus,Retrovirus-related Pol polyprotein from transposon 412 [Mytilus coruscus]|uniref:Reverse transcriptase domain-containing protein n=1 Tax=Mytilus coruscus TaxID=42192 RepID=A0A6J8D824_MYTCO|nr:Retrovirus-related Pol polyprotein from transposon gypsy,Retrovirus-related Pol polyprotein from transposon 297,Retrovirus-related Pol polyprotein from transposon 17.6,Transposon Ty3-I Gag-Pol polyprotein,Transposon Ty3-G Gag-Pol polyprotein,Retrovirus-related Pol polyprotein from transposon opus,Retrovirus-related Pol polyprotein from transposon 412 [Mytilus coruscus]